MIFTKNNAKFSFLTTNYLGLKPEATNISLLTELFVHIPESPYIIINRSFLFACLYIKFSRYFCKATHSRCTAEFHHFVLTKSQYNPSFFRAILSCQIQYSLIQISGLIYCTFLWSFNAIGMISFSSPRFQSGVSCRKNMSAVGTDHIQKSVP